jgi:hypothetical protein
MIFFFLASFLALIPSVVNAAYSSQVNKAHGEALATLASHLHQLPGLGSFESILPRCRRLGFTELIDRAHGMIIRGNSYPNTILFCHDSDKTIPIHVDTNSCIVTVEARIDGANCSASYFFHNLGLVMLLKDGMGGQLFALTGLQKFVYTEGAANLSEKIAFILKHPESAAFFETMESTSWRGCREILQRALEHEPIGGSTVKSMNVAEDVDGQLRTMYGLSIKMSIKSELCYQSIFIGLCNGSLVKKEYWLLNLLA